MDKAVNLQEKYAEQTKQGTVLNMLCIYTVNFANVPIYLVSAGKEL